MESESPTLISEIDQINRISLPDKVPRKPIKRGTVAVFYKSHLSITTHFQVIEETTEQKSMFKGLI